MTVRSKLGAIRRQYWERQLPKVFNVTALTPNGVRFEATSIPERQRIVTIGDELDYMRAMISALRPDDVLYDIGANVGLVSLHAARKCRTVAFEPDPSFRVRLLRNLELNPEISVDVLPIAISDSDGAARLFTDGSDGNSPSLIAQRGEQHDVNVTTQTLDTLVTSKVVPAPTVLKVDIEGAEILALRGAKQVLGASDGPRALFLEVHDSFLPAFGSSPEEVTMIVREAGYERVRYEARRSNQQHLILERAATASLNTG